jgi:Ca2+-binding RTX toxin-like protein
MRLSLIGLVAAAAVVLPSAPSQAAPATCQGREATIVGPTAPPYTTVGTEGDDVIVAPLSPGSGVVQGLGGDDAICFVGGGEPDPTGRTVSVDAGDGDDSVLNQTVSSLYPLVTLGAGSDHYVGNDFGEYVDAGQLNGIDSDVDVVETLGGNDNIASGSPSRVENHDLISTGAGRDFVSYGNPSGELVDNGAGADTLAFGSLTPHAWLIDNVGGRLSVGDLTMLTWTNVNTFRTSETKGDSFSFRGTDADETLVVDGLERRVTFRGGSIITGGGNDTVELQNYLPGRVDLGAGTDGLDYQMYSACRSATMTMGGSADCSTLEGQDEVVVTGLVGIERLRAQTRHRLNIVGTAHRDVITANSPVLRIHSGAGPDRVQIEKAADSMVWGGRGDDTLTGFVRKSLVLRGGRGDDILRGAATPDRLYGGSGRDLANGRGGRDICVAEVRKRCELPR